MYQAVCHHSIQSFTIIRCGLRFYCYNPLAGGILAGVHKFEDKPDSGRFNSKTPWGIKYQDRFWHKPIFDSLGKIGALAANNNLTLVDVAMRWLYCHSKLQEGDGVIIGGTIPDCFQT